MPKSRSLAELSEANRSAIDRAVASIAPVAAGPALDTADPVQAQAQALPSSSEGGEIGEAVGAAVLGGAKSLIGGEGFKAAGQSAVTAGKRSLGIEVPTIGGGGVGAGGSLPSDTPKPPKTGDTNEEALKKLKKKLLPSIFR